MSRLRALEVRASMGHRLHLTVDPSLVAGWVISEAPLVKAARSDPRVTRLPPPIRDRWLSRLARHHPFVLRAAQFPAVTPFAEHAVCAVVTDLVVHHRADPLHSLWYEELCTRLAERGPLSVQGWSVRRPEDAERFLVEYILPIVDSLELHGYRTDLTEDLGYALVGKDGEVLKSKQATHRFFIARALRLPTFPVRITAVHKSWWRNAVCEHHDRRRPADWRERLEAAIAGVAEAHRG
jgi:hypothetical protein